jgi:DNA (cytosine-5)-methyltransferase 1
MNYLELCTGISAPSVAWGPLGWRCVGHSEIKPFANEVLARHYPGIRNYGNLNEHEKWNIEPGSVDVVVAGTPCQSFSVGNQRRAGINDPRGELALEAIRLVARIRPRVVVWENVVGVLSSRGGRDFAAIVGALADVGYGYAWRVLDCQHFGIPQRRRRVYVVGHNSGLAERAADILFERTGVPQHYQANRRNDGTGAWWNGNHIAQTMDTTLTKYQTMPERNRLPVVRGVASFSATNATTKDIVQFVATTTRSARVLALLRTTGLSIANQPTGTCTQEFLRRLMPIEVERLMGFPDGYTDVRPKGTPDACRLEVLGNSMGVPTMAWLGRRIMEHG